MPPPQQQSSVSCISSYSDLCRRDSVSPPFLPPTVLRAETPRSHLPYPAGDYTSPPGSVIVAPGGALSPPQSPPSISASTSPSGGGGSSGRPRPVSVAGLPASSISQAS
ncbi:hypothetical protein BC834DRAFT_890979 [Gloeopeniophorella convolvens]|nr:hypothetical protein BC834DRAFT_890979 [Gloeopeniophorella convolvens]